MSDRFLLDGHYYQYDLGWMIRKLMEFENSVQQIIDLQTIHYADPIQWDITTQYPPNTVVVDPKSGTAYMSKKAVPSGILLTNAEYWVVIFNYQEIYNKIMAGVAYNAKNSETATKDLLVNDLVWFGGDLYRATRAIPTGTKFVPGTNITLTSIESLLSDYYGRNRNAQLMNDTTTVSGDYTVNAGDIAETSTNRTEKITKDREIDIDGTDSLHVDGVSTINRGGAVTEVNGASVDRRTVGATTENFEGDVNRTYIGKVVDTYTGGAFNLGESHVNYDSLILGHANRYMISGTDLNTPAFLSQFGLNLSDDDAMDAGLAYIREHGGTLIIDRNITITRSIILHSYDSIDFQNHIVTVNGQVNGIQSEYVDGKAPVKIAIRNLRLNGNNKAYDGIHLNSSASIIENVDVYNCTMNGIITTWVESETENGRNPLENTYKNIRIWLNGYVGFLFKGPHDSYFENIILVSNSQAEHNKYANFEADNANFRGVHLHSWNLATWATTNRAAYAILLKDSQAVQISDSHFEGGSTANVFLDGGRNVAMSNCYFYSSYGPNDIIISAQSNMFTNCYVSNYSKDAAASITHSAHIVFGNKWNVSNYFNLNFAANDQPCVDESKASNATNMYIISSTTNTASIINRKSGWYLSNNDHQHFGTPLDIYGNISLRQFYLSNNTTVETIPDTVGVIILPYLSVSKKVNLPTGSNIATGTMIWLFVPSGTSAGTLTFSYSGTIEGAKSMTGTNRIACLVKSNTTQWTITVL